MRRTLIKWLVRGGSWLDDDATYLAARARNWLAPSSRVSLLGFRCAKGKRC